MIPYISVFSISCLCFYFSKYVNKTLRRIIYSFALLLPCLLSAYRANSIGTDVGTYLLPMTEAAISSDDFSQYLNYSWFVVFRYEHVYDFEIGFTLIVYILSKIFKNIFAVKFVIQLLSILPVFVACKKVDKENLLWFYMLIYYLSIYNVSLNLMRQAISMSFLLLGFVYLIKDYKFYTFISFCVAFLFHTSAIIGLFIYCIYMILKYNKYCFYKDQASKYIFATIVICLFSIFAFLFINNIVIFSDVIGFAKYSGYVSGNVVFLFSQLLIRIPIIIFFLYVYICNYKIRNNILTYTFIVLLLFDCICAQFSSVNTFGGRIALYFSQFEILSFPYFCINYKKKVSIICFIAYLILYWYYFFVYSGSNATMPYIPIV